MSNSPILIIEDDLDDQEIFAEAIKTVGVVHPVIFFSNATSALEYMGQTDEQPYIVISDVNMPGMTGFEFRRIIKEDPYLAAKGVPFIIISTNAAPAAVRRAHALSVQGYFEKPKTLAEIVTMFRTIFEYWDLCRHINNTY